MEPFVEGFLNPEWINQLGNKDRNAIRPRAFYLPGTRIKPEVNCCASSCVLPSKSAEYFHPIELKNEYYPMMFCYFCDRCFHVKCLNLTLDMVNTEKVPFQCLDCRKDCMNIHAQSFYTASKYTISVKNRRKQHLRTSTIDSEADFDTDGEFDSADIASFRVHDSTVDFRSGQIANSTHIPSSTVQQSEIEMTATRRVQELEQTLAEERRTLAEERKKSAAKINNMDQQMAELKRQMAEFLSQQPSSSRTAPENGANRLNVDASHTLNQFYSSNNLLPQIERAQAHYTPTQPTIQHSSRTDSRGTNENDLTQVMDRFTSCQERIEMDRFLANRRKAMPKIAEFHGDPMKWLEFQQDVERYKTVCQYDDETIKLHLRGALKGNAFSAVRDVFDIFTLTDIMKILKEAFGDPMVMVRRRAKEVKEIKLQSTLYRDEVVKIKVKIQGYFAACTYAKTGCLNSNELGEQIYDQFGVEDKTRCKELFVRKYPGQQIVVNLNLIYDYLTERLPLLDERPFKKSKDSSDDIRGKEDKKNKPFQVYSISSGSPKSDDKEAYKFKIKDKATAPYTGYDMAKVNLVPKNCYICNRSNHFSIECHQYQKLNENQRAQLISDKKLCKNCVISISHRAIDCDLKLGCGLKVDRANRCTHKHHISIHNANAQNDNRKNFKLNRRSNTNINTAKANQAIQDAINSSTGGSKSTQQPSTSTTNTQNTPNNINVGFHAHSARQYEVSPHPQFTGVVQLHHYTSEKFGKTVKMFKNRFIGPKGIVTAYSIGDSGAEATLVRNDLRIALGIEGESCQVSLQWSDETIKVCPAVKFDLIVQGILPYSERIILKDCYGVDDLYLARRSLNMEFMRKKFPYLKDVNFESYEDEEPVVLIGSPHAFMIENTKLLLQGGNGCPVAIEAKLGISVYGGAPSDTNSMSVNSQSIVDDEEDENKVSNEELHGLLSRFNSIEAIGVRTNSVHITENDRKAITILTEQMKVLDNGSIEVPLIWDRKDNEIPSIPNNFGYAYKRQQSQEAKLRKNELHLKAYNENVKELLRLGYCRHADAIDMETPWKNVWYMPMSLVVNANKDPPKYRNVYDASAKYQGTSLNDLLLKGPDLLIDLLKPLLIMRMNRIAFTADVQQMFHRVVICRRDQQCQRILWRENHSEPFQTLILCAMAFGPSCSPFVSQFVKNWNADKFASQYPKASKAIKELMYMDDLIASEPTVAKATEIANQCIAICKDINWNLISFQSNSKEFLKSLPGENIKKELIPIIANEQDEYTTKVLGCNWNTTLDCFVFQLDRNIFVKLVNEFEYHPTKRDLASTIARIYDVMGLIAHFIIRGKILLQRCWKLKIDWDDKIPENLKKEWRKWLAEIENVARLQIPRMYCDLDSLQEADEIQLHIFSDAGVEAFGCVAYFAIRRHDTIYTRMIMGKAKVTPLRLKTESEIKEIPRLELLAALLAARLSQTICRTYDMLKVDKYFWTDSEIVLKWITNPNHSLIKFAVSPVEEILELTERSEWKYVPTTENPADYCTKFKECDFSDPNSMWFTGPEFLKKPQDEWPKIEATKLKFDDVRIINNIYFEKFNYSSYTLPFVNCLISNDEKLDNLSESIKASWPKLVRATARALKLYWDAFIPIAKNCQLGNYHVKNEIKQIFNSFSVLLPRDLERAEQFIFRKIQRQEFETDYKLMLDGKRITRKDWLELNVFMDPQGIIRINSRVNLNSLTYPQQFLPLLPRKNELIYVLLRHYHLKYKHIALESQIAEVRTKCWIPQLRRELKTVKARCNYCNVKNAKRCNPTMAPLPDYRINPALQPFEVTGIDALGPLQIKGRPKTWILIFVCSLTRFIHLHILESLEALRVLEAIVVFWAAHGPVRKFVSDNGTNFVGAARTIREDAAQERVQLKKSRTALVPKLSEMYGVDWEFIPPGSPWMGGFYERLIKEVKRSLAEVLTRRRKPLSKIELNIAIHETSHRINLRPLTHNSIAAEDDVILTPHHLAKHRSGWPLLPGLHKDRYSVFGDKTIYQNGRKVADQIMEKFVSTYLPELTRKAKWIKTPPSLVEGDLVLYIMPNNTRKEWLRARIVKIYKGRDGCARVADILFGNGVIKEKCAIRHLAKIDIAI